MTEEKADLLVRLSHDAVISIDQEQLITLFNHAAEEIFGYSASEVLGQPLAMLLPPQIRDLHETQVRSFAQSTAVERTMGARKELIGQRKDGTTFPARASIFKYKLPDKTIELTVILEDITGDKYLKELEESVRIARQIQQHLFPKMVPDLPGVDLSTVNIPSQGISGDYYDVIRIVDGHWGIVIADVAGKGISAGLMMSTFRAALLAEIRNQYAITTILERVGNLLWETTAENRFVTAFYGVFDECRRLLTYSNAGHNPPILFRTDGTVSELDTGGVLLGAFPGCTYHEECVTLATGDWLVFYTDGLTESPGPRGEELGREGLVELLQELSGESASVISQSLIETTARCHGTGPPSDDISLVVMKITGPSQGEA